MFFFCGTNITILIMQDSQDQQLNRDTVTKHSFIHDASGQVHHEVHEADGQVYHYPPMPQSSMPRTFNEFFENQKSLSHQQKIENRMPGPVDSPFSYPKRQNQNRNSLTTSDCFCEGAAFNKAMVLVNLSQWVRDKFKEKTSNEVKFDDFDEAERIRIGAITKFLISSKQVMFYNDGDYYCFTYENMKELSLTWITKTDTGFLCIKFT